MRTWIRAAFFAVITICLTGCAAVNEQPAARGKARAYYGKGTNRVYRRGGSYSLRTPEISGTMTSTPAASGLSKEERSRKIAESVTQLDQIKGATAVITGNTAIVGVEMDSQYADSELIDIKRMVEEKVKSADKGIDHVSVTTAEDMVGRINHMPDSGSGEDPPITSPGDFVPRG
ncbi:MAG: YhcN/YlaJ family sporulation lipoprotein [Clostridiales bacterium]|jgi:YhcN/YlaJ family sporulation lipoprotein|nr:YhcN/YlaJ family sporulation lipoprotein [Clostridiales bacterium]